MPCPETEVLLGGSTIHLLFLSSGFFNLETGFCRQMCKSAPTYAVPHHLDSCGWPRTHMLSFHLALMDARIFLHRSTSVWCCQVSQGPFGSLHPCGFPHPWWKQFQHKYWRHAHLNFHFLPKEMRATRVSFLRHRSCFQLLMAPRAPQVYHVVPGWAHFTIMKTALFFFCVIFFQSIMLALFFFSVLLEKYWVSD